MGIKTLLEQDIKVLYSDFALDVIYKTRTVPALRVHVDEMFESETLFLSFIKSDVSDIAIEDSVLLADGEYIVSNFEPKDEYEIELIVALKRK